VIATDLTGGTKVKCDQRLFTDHINPIHRWDVPEDIDHAVRDRGGPFSFLDRRGF
jgi:hypothetical protein